MKSELFDIQNALNACRSSLGKLELSDEISSSTSSVTTSSDSSSLQSPGRLSRCNSPILLNFVKEPVSNLSAILNGHLLSRPMTKRKQTKAVKSVNSSRAFRAHRKASSTKNSSQFTNSISCSSSLSMANSSVSSGKNLKMNELSRWSPQTGIFLSASRLSFNLNIQFHAKISATIRETLQQAAQPDTQVCQQESNQLQRAFDSSGQVTQATTTNSFIVNSGHNHHNNHNDHRRILDQDNNL